MKDLYGFVFKLLLLCVTLYFTCDFALKSKHINTSTGIGSLIGVTILVCLVFWYFRCNPEGEITPKNKPRKEILDFLLKLFLLSITIYFICDFAQKSNMNSKLSIASVVILTIIICVLFLTFKRL